MILLSGANISIVRDGKEYVAIVQVGYTSKTAAAADPVRALGLAIMLQAGYTENSLKKELQPKTE